MAFAAVNSTSEPRAYSTGPLKKQILTWSCISGDTSGTVTATSLSSVQHIILDGGLILTAAPTFSGNAVTLAFNDPAVSVFGTCVVYGK